MSSSIDDNANEATRVFSVFTEPTKVQSTVIVGAGIIGCATAYFLSQSEDTKTDTIHLVEASPELFASASGKAGGFCVSDWFGSASASLGALSFRLHKELADQNGGRERWGYTRSTATSMTQSHQSKQPSNEDWLGTGGSRADVALVDHVEAGAGPTWLTKRPGDTVEMIGRDGDVAQVDPMRLCQFLLRESIMRGVRLHHPAKPMKISRNENGELSAVRVLHDSGAVYKIPCTRLLITAGAWTPSVFHTLFPTASMKLPISQLAGHSLVVKSGRWTKELEDKGCHAIFASMRNGLSPEAFSRIGGEIWIGGVNDPSMPLPAIAGDAKVDRGAMDKLLNVAKDLLGEDGVDDLEIVREGVCFRPVTRRGEPILARIPDDRLGDILTRPGVDGGVYVASGHGPWGIALSLGTGKVMAEMMERHKTSANIGSLGLS